MKKRFEGLVALNCEYDSDIVAEIYKAFEAQENKIAENAKEIRLMKEMLKKFARQLPEEKATTDLTMINNNKKEFLLTSGSVNRSENEWLEENIPDCETAPLATMHCQAYSIEWYYNIQDGRCVRYRQGCEERMMNSYPSERECIAVCVRPGGRNDCLLPPSPGLCRGVVSSWYYDYKDNTCNHFIYKGCLGNKNRFSDKDSCWKKCGVGDSHKEILETKREQGIIPYHGSYADGKNTNNAGTEADGHYPEYIPLENNRWRIHKKQKEDNTLQNTIPMKKIKDHTSNDKPHKQKDEETVHHNLINSVGTSPHDQVFSSLNNKKKLHQMKYPNIRYSDSDGQDKITRSKQENYVGFNNMHKQQENMYGHLRNTISRPRQYRYVYNDLMKKRSKISKTQNLKASSSNMFDFSISAIFQVELVPPQKIDSGKPFKMRCVVRGSLVNAVDIIWSKDSTKHGDRSTKWKERKTVNKADKKV